MVNLKELINNLYNYRQLLKSNVQKDIRGKYKGSFLGILWSFVNPLLMTLVYAIVFPIIMKSTEPHYTTFLVIAILPWNYFTTVINQGTTSILMNAGIIKKPNNEIAMMSFLENKVLRNVKSFESSLMWITKSSKGVSIKNPVPITIIAITDKGKKGRKTKKK